MAETTLKKSELLLIVSLTLVAMALVTVAVVPSLRNKVKEVFNNSERIVVAKVTGQLTPRGPRVTVLKIRSRQILSLEVFTQNESGELVLMTKLPLFENRDGYFLYKGNATNLALADVDNDGQLEIVAPTYDDQMVPRLNVYRYNQLTKSFDKVSAPPDFETK